MREILATGAIGELLFLHARYGHGGWIGYEKESTSRAGPGIEDAQAAL